jgi:hypothetical protein
LPTTTPAAEEPAIPLRVASRNCQGCSTDDKLNLILNDADPFHITLLQETNLLPVTDSGSRINHLDIPADWTLAAPSKAVTATNRGKGLLILAHPDLTASSPAALAPAPIIKPVHEVVCASFELMAAVITNVIVVNIYVHANTPPDYPALKDAIASTPGFGNANVLVGGDFNHPTRRQTLEHDVMAALGLSPAYDPNHPIPTRKSNPLDLMFWKGEAIDVSPMQASHGSTSDHLIVSTEVHGTTVASLIAPCTPPSMIFWDDLPDLPYDLLSSTEKEQHRDFVAECQRVLTEACTGDDPLSAMTDGLLSVAAQFLGTKEYRTKKRTPWWNKGLSRLHKTVRRAHKRTLQTNAPSTCQRRYAAEYKAILSKYSTACSKARQRCLESFQRKFKPTDMNRTWQATASYRGKRHPKFMRRTAADPDKTCAVWQAVFSDTRFDHPPQPQPTPPSRVILTTDSASCAIKEMNDTTPGEDGLRAKLLNFLGSDPSCLKSITTGLNRACALTLSDRAKTSVTVLIKKPKAVGSDPGSYRPIALQPVMTKLLSKCVEQQILKQIDDGSVRLSDNQGGFRAERSRYDLILLLRCAQEHYHPQGRSSAGRADRKLYAAFLDIKKAYDSVPHSKILARLRDAGVREELVRVVADLLWNRTTIIYGKTINIGRGVPQGDPLSPLLFILMLQSLSDEIATLPCGGASLPGGLTLKDLLYADDMALLAESPEDLVTMLQVCQRWANENGFTFSVEKSKVMVLAGANPQQMPIIDMYGEALEWVKVFQYLGFPIYANNKHLKYLPLDLTSVYQIVGPMISVLRPNSPPDLPLTQRAQAFYTMVEGKALHNAQVADMDVKKVDSYVNKGLKLITGLLDSTHVRCDLGILPSELVVHRNAMYYLWHLRRRAWFHQYIPSLAHLQPIKRLTSMILRYKDLQLHDTDHLEYDQWRRVVKKAVLERAATYYSVGDYSNYNLFPQDTYGFKYLGQAYLTNLHTTHLAQTAIELRHDRLCGVPSPWEHKPCVYCDQPQSLNGRHLLQCPGLPANLLQQRSELIEGSYPELSLSHFTQSTIACVGAQEKDIGHPLLLFLRKSLTLGRKIMRHARKAVKLAIATEEQADESLSALPQLFEEVPEEQELVDAFPLVCSLQNLDTLGPQH